MARGIATGLKERLYRRANAAHPPALLSSKGIARHCDHRGPPDYWLLGTETCQPPEFFRRHYADAAGLVWVRLSTQARDGRPCDLDGFVAGALPTIRRPFVLVTSDGDVAVPGELPPATVAALLDCPFLVAWFTQNHDGHPHPKLRPLPMGLDLHTPGDWRGPRYLARELRRIRRRRGAIADAPLRVFCDLGLAARPTRRAALAALAGSPLVDFQERRLPRTAIWRRYARSGFAVSAPGNGADCHRTWELLLLGVIVIARHSALDPLYQGLPVALVEDWREATELERLRQWRQTLGPLTDQALVWPRLDPATLLRPARQLLA